MEFQSGKWLVICDRCGFKRLSDQVTKTWDNLIVCKPAVKEGCFEHRHPQDFVRAVPDDTSVPFTRSQPTDLTTTVNYVAPTVGVQDTRIPAGNFTTNNEEL
jgi:hypothetical protein